MTPLAKNLLLIREEGTEEQFSLKKHYKIIKIP